MTSTSGRFVKAVADGDVSTVSRLLADDPDLARSGGYSAHTALAHFVLENGGRLHREAHLRIAELLTPPSVRSFRDAVVADDLQTVQATLHADPALVHAQFANGRGLVRAIHVWRSVEVAECLIEHGADIHALSSLNESAVAIQVRVGSVSGVRFLLESGVDPNVGQAGHICSSHFNECLELLLAFGWDINRGHLLHDANHGHAERVKTWIRHGADPDQRDANGRTPLHLLAARGTGKAAIHALVTAGADMDALDDKHQTPLALADAAPQDSAAETLRQLASARASGEPR